MPIFHLDNRIQHYDWGTLDAIPDLLGIKNPAKKPFAELWMGAHPKAPSMVQAPEGGIPLTDYIARDPKAALGEPVLKRFGPSLPFLFKVLSAARPLSIQAHPSKRKAESGFKKENSESVPLDAPDRNYRDDNHKPEMLVALNDFEGLCGFRPIPEILRLVRLLAPREFKRIVGHLESNPGKVELSVLFYRFITYSANLKQDLLYHTGNRIDRLLREDLDEETRLVFEWIHRLMAVYPGDIGALSPMIMNLFRLAPGEAIFLEPGQIHAYLQGTGLEIMANSDNVLRGALTSKYVDIPELLSILSFTPENISRLVPVRVDDSVEEYPSGAAEFRLDRLRLTGTQTSGRRLPGPEIHLCLEGRVTLAEETKNGSAESLDLEKGGCAFVPAQTERYTLKGEGLVFRAGVTV